MYRLTAVRKRSYLPQSAMPPMSDVVKPPYKGARLDSGGSSDSSNIAVKGCSPSWQISHLRMVQDPETSNVLPSPFEQGDSRLPGAIADLTMCSRGVRSRRLPPGSADFSCTAGDLGIVRSNAEHALKRRMPNERATYAGPRLEPIQWSFVFAIPVATSRTLCGGASGSMMLAVVVC